jgi:undecaprenyl-diphosphatase
MDDFVEDAINGLAGQSGLLDALMKFAAKDLVFALVLLMPLLWFWPAAVGQRSLNERIAATAVGAGALALLVALAVAHLHHASRPFVSDPATRQLIGHAADNGFPSEHATFAFAIGGAIVRRRRLVGAIALAIAVWIGFARVFVGIHWPADILAGAAIGLTAGALTGLALPWLEGPQTWAGRFLPPVLLSSANGDIQRSAG